MGAILDRRLSKFCNGLQQVRTMVFRSHGWRRALVAFAAGSFSVFAMAPFFFWPILFLTFPILVWLIDSAHRPSFKEPNPPAHAGGAMKWVTMRTTALDGWWFGFGYFLFGLFWIGEAFLVEKEIFGWLMPVAVILMPAGLALFYAATMAVTRVFWPTGLSRIFILAVVLGAGDWVRGHVFTGFPWNVFGYAFTYPLTLMQSASLIGVYGLTLWVVLVCAAPLILVSKVPSNIKARRQAVFMGLLIAGFPLLAMTTFGAIKLANTPTTYVDGVKLRLVQPSVPQRDKWLSEKQSGIFADHLALSRTNENGLFDNMAGITHVIWPEASMPFLPLKSTYALQRIAELLPKNAHLIAGALRVENTKSVSEQIPYENPGPAHETAKARAGPDTSNQKARTGPQALPRVFNSMMAFDGEGKLEALYDKTHLVPFGEYLPFRKTLESIGLSALTRLRGGFETGRTPRPLVDIPGLSTAGVLICYEVIFPGQVIKAKSRPSLLINLTNDGWFGNTTGPYQHFHNSRVRAVEEGLPLIRSANNGISAVIDPLGRVLDRLDLNVRGTIDSRLPRAQPPTIYAIWNDVLFVLNAIGFLVLAWFLRARRQP